ncbi:MAG: hypothetical protein M1816_004175 [Peltula sp. TS41687]|nr:MAG: hypothetical protein M1816_004175 [Peltula sp. TS41687]
MPSVDRDNSRDRETDRHIKPQLALTEISRPHVPMWDSSDPDRAPPPLPLNPSSPGTITRANASATVAAAAAALTEKARESAGASPYTINPMPSKRDTSPEKSLIRSHHHKRMQSFQLSNGSLKDMTGYFDGSSLRQTETSPERYGARSGSLANFSPTTDLGDLSPDKSPTRANTPVSYLKESGRITPTLRSSSRQPPKSILGDNTPPPSATMLALQTMPTPANLDEPLSRSLSPTRPPQSIDLSSQILSLTSIATNLQREMMQLSRRSKDNATDLVSLKEATNARDEDIRQCLRELVQNLTSRLNTSGDSALRLPDGRGVSSGSEGFLLDNKPHTTPPTIRGTKNFALPRIPSPNTFSAVLERELANSPSPYAMDGAANLALLEKILREMGTKEGQERILSSITEVVEKTSRGDGETARRLEEIANLIKESLENRAIVKPGGGEHGNGNSGGNPNFTASEGHPQRRELGYEASHSGPLVRAFKDLTRAHDAGNHPENKKAYGSQNATEGLSDDVQKLLRRLKDSVTENGGLTAEVKALVRELRGEVLGMGRDMARKLDEVGSRNGADKSLKGAEREEMIAIVQNGLMELKEHIDRLTKDKRRQSAASSISRNSVDSGEIFDAVKHAMGELQLHRSTGAERSSPDFGKEEILEAIREAWESYKPEIELQNFGLEREEILQCLKEGLEEYRPSSQARDGLSREEVLNAVRDGLDNFIPPPTVAVAPDLSILRDEILGAVRDALEAFEFPTVPAAAPRQCDLTRDDIVGAVKEGLDNFDFPSHGPLVRGDVDITKNDIYSAVRKGLEGAQTPMNGLGQEVLESLHEVIEGMRIEFKGVSDEAKQNVAANGRDTEQVLDALKDGLEHLRSHIEVYIGRLSLPTENDDAGERSTEHILNTLKDGLEHLRADMEVYVDRAAADVTGNHVGTNMKNIEQILDALKSGLESLRSDVELYVDRAADVTGKDEIIETVRDGFDRLKTDIGSAMAVSTPAAPDTEILEDLKGEIGHLRETIATTLLRSGSSSDRDEIIEAIRLGLDDLRSDMERKNDRPESILSGTGEILDALSDGLDGLRSDIQKLEAKPADSNVFENTLREGLDGLRSDIHSAVVKPIDTTGYDELAYTLKEGFEALRSDIHKIEAKPLDTSVLDELADTLKEGLASLRVDIDRLNERSSEKRELSPERNQIIVAQPDSLKRNDIENLEVLITQLRIKVEALDAEARDAPSMPEPSQPTADAVSKDDLVVLEQQLKNIEAGIHAMAERERQDESSNAKKEDVEAIETLLRNTKAKIDDMILLHSEPTAKREDIESIELLIKDTKDAFEEIAARIETGQAKKDDLAFLESILREIKSTVEDVRAHTSNDVLEGEKVTKTDVDAIEGLCMDIKAQIDQLAMPDLDTLPTKAQMNSIAELIKEYQERTQGEVDGTTKAIEDVKVEYATVVEGVSDIRAYLDDLQTDLKHQIQDGGEGVQAIGKVLESLEDRVGAAADIGLDVKEVLETMMREFERSHGIGEGIKLDQEARSSEILQKVEERFEELMARYDHAQVATEEMQKLTDERAIQNDKMLAESKAITDELKITADTLGITITEAADKMGQDSKTVFNRVEDTYGRVEDMRCETKADFDETKAQIEKALGLLAGLRGQLSEHEPKIISSINDVLSLAREHFEHSQKQAKKIREEETMPKGPPPMITDIPEKYDDAQVHEKLDKLISHAKDDVDAEVHAKLDRLISQATSDKEAEVHAKLDRLIDQANNVDETEVHAKLDQLMDQASAAGKSLAQMDMLDQIHQQVLSTASEVSAFFASQSRLLTQEHEAKGKQAEEAAIALAQRLVQKERVENEVIDLTDEKESLRESVNALKAEREDLLAHRTRLAADVASLETARKLRHEELGMMEARAENLERRILEGIIDHSRALLISRPQNKDPQNMSLKRVISQGQGQAPNGPGGPVSSLPQSTISLALKTRPAPIRTTAGGPNSSNNGRRILSLNQITGNVPTGAQAFSPTPSMVPSNKVITSLKRSHSVKSGSGLGYTRKASLGGRGRYDQSQLADKENRGRHADDDEGEIDEDDDRSTEYFDSEVDDDDTRTETIDRRTSTGTMLSGTTGTMLTGSMIEEEEEGAEDIDDEDDGDGSTTTQGEESSVLLSSSAVAEPPSEGDVDVESVGKKMVLYDGPADSGVGEEPTTADLEGKNFEEAVLGRVF